MTDRRGVAEEPNTGPMQRMADALRELSVGDHPAEKVRATAKAGADMLELQTDWLLDQHRLIEDQNRTINVLGTSVRDALEMVRELLGKIG